MKNITRSHGFTLIELLVVVAIIAVLAAILFPVFARAKEKANQTTCTNSQKQLAASMMMYAQDHEETLPPADGWTLALTGLDPKTFDCPTTNDEGTAGKPEYGYNQFLGKTSTGQPASIGELDDPSGILLTGDSLVQTTNSATQIPGCIYNQVLIAERHSGKAIMSALDGHVVVGSSNTLKLRLPPVSGDLILWLMPENMTKQGSGSIKKWADESGKKNDVGPDGAVYGAVTDNVQNGYPGFELTVNGSGGCGSFVAMPKALDIGAVTCFAAYQMTAKGNYDDGILQAGGDVPNAVAFTFRPGDATTVPTISTYPTVFMATYGKPAVSATRKIQTFGIGRKRTLVANSTALAWNNPYATPGMKVCEILCYHDDMPQSDIDKVMAYLKAKYAL